MIVRDILQPTHLLFLVVVVLLVFGPKRLPEIGRTLGEGLRGFKSSLTGDGRDSEDDPNHMGDQIESGRDRP